MFQVDNNISTWHFIPIPTTEVYNLFIGLSMVGSASMMFCSICQWGMVPDTIEYGHWKTGIRAEGLPLTFFTFMQKSAMAFGAGVASLVLWATGFVANTELTESALSKATCPTASLQLADHGDNCSISQALA